jgi:hypothetical protein
LFLIYNLHITNYYDSTTTTTKILHMMRIVILLLLSAAAGVRAACDNQCSGHGTCLADDICQCYAGWGMGLSHDSGDCSDRICPYDIAWVDTPDVSGKFHKYSECSTKGICDRSSGNCVCFDGFEGSACQRSSCPNACSGHGTCEFIQDLGFASTWNDYQSVGFSDDTKHFAYHVWDQSKSRACRCDAQYGDIDCSKRMCPYGTDVLAVEDNLLVGAKYHQQKILLVASTEATTVGAGSILQGSTFALTFKSKMNESFTTIPIVFDKTDMPEMANNIQLALLNLPNRVIDGIQVVAVQLATVQTVDAFGYKAAATTPTIYPVLLTFTFSGESVQGNQNPLIVEDYACASGCTPKISGLDLNTRFAYETLSYLSTSAPSSFYTSYECGRRGKCDYTLGSCQCFSGYSGENCNVLQSLF